MRKPHVIAADDAERMLAEAIEQYTRYERTADIVALATTPEAPAEGLALDTDRYPVGLVLRTSW